jgi:hypothetical protein
MTSRPRPVRAAGAQDLAETKTGTMNLFTTRSYQPEGWLSGHAPIALPEGGEPRGAQGLPG